MWVGISSTATHYRSSDLYHRKHPLFLTTDPYQVRWNGHFRRKKLKRLFGLALTSKSVIYPGDSLAHELASPDFPDNLAAIPVAAYSNHIMFAVTRFAKWLIERWKNFFDVIFIRFLQLTYILVLLIANYSAYVFYKLFLRTVNGLQSSASILIRFAISSVFYCVYKFRVKLMQIN